MFEAIRRVSLLGALLPSHTEVFAAVGLAVVSVAVSDRVRAFLLGFKA